MYFITGGTGFIGAHVVKALLPRGRPITLFDLHPDRATLALVAGGEALASAAIVEGDAAQPGELFRAIADSKAECVIHLASLLPPAAEREASASLNAITSAHIAVLDAARAFRLRRVVWASATSVFGRPHWHGGPEASVDDDAPHYPETLYGITKSANERLSALYFERHGVDSIGFRFCQGYGPGKKRGRPFGYRLFECALLGEPLAVPYADDVVNWQHVRDIADILVRGLDAPPTTTRVFNTSGEVITMAESLEIIAELAPQARFMPEPGVTGLVWRYRTERLAREIGFRDPTPVRAGFAETLATMRAWRAAGRW